MSVKDDKLETAGQAHLRAGSAVSLVFSKRWFILVTGELPIGFRQWASCFADLVTYYLHRR